MSLDAIGAEGELWQYAKVVTYPTSLPAVPLLYLIIPSKAFIKDKTRILKFRLVTGRYRQRDDPPRYVKLNRSHAKTRRSQS